MATPSRIRCIIGVLLTMGLLRMIFRVNVPAEAAQYASAIAAKHLPIERMSIEIRSPAAAGVPLMRLPSLLPNLHEVYPGVIVSRVMHAGKQHVAQPSDVLQVRDVMTCAATRPQLEKLRDLVGVESSVRLDGIDSPVVARDMAVTRPRVFGKHIADLHIHPLCGVTVAWLNRAGIDLASAPGVKLQFGDHITCVGEDRLRQVETIVGNQTSARQHSQIITIFVGIALGVLLGSIPVFIPGMPAPLSLGLAGGPVVVAIVLARIGTIGPLHWNMPPDTIDTVRELGRVVVHGLSQQDQTKEVNRQRAAHSLLWHYYWALRLAEINPEAQQELTAMFMLMETSGFVSPSTAG